ncbi:MAG: hypothetical protein ISS77_01150 [Phycisphaerae bacterium]|nr:hypothetical protein [Phycisphaerae bacterium]
MEAEEKLEAKPKKRTRTRILKLALVIVVILILLLVFLLPAFVSSEKGRKTILAKINNSIDGRTDFSGLTMSWWKGVKVTDLSFEDNAGQVMVKVKQIATTPHYASILLGSLSFGETVIEKPEIDINLKDSQSQKAEGSNQKTSVDKKTQPIILPIKRIDLVVNEGSLKITSSNAETVELSQINSKLNLNPPGQQTSFDIDMTVVDKDKKSKISATGQVTPSTKGWGLKGTNGNLTVEINDLDIGSLEPLFALAGIEVQANGSISAQVKSELKDGQIENLSGIVKGKALDITGPGFRGDRFKSDVLNIDIELASKPGLINVDSLQIHSDWVDAKTSGVVPTTFKSLAEFLEADSIYNLEGTLKCDLAKALSQMPHTFGVREGIKVTSGQLIGDVRTLTKDNRRMISGQASLAGLQGIIEGKTVILSEPVKAEVKITSSDSGITFDKLEVSAPFARLNCTGTGELLEYDAEINLATFQSQLGQFIDIGQYKIAGEILSKGTVSIKEKEIAAVGSAVVKELRLSSPEDISAFEPKADMFFSATIERDKNILDIKSVEAKASFGKISIKDASIPLDKKSAEPMELDISAEVDLAGLVPFVVLLASFPADMQLEGTAVSNLSIQAKKDSYHITTDATEIKNLKIVSPGQKPFEQTKISVTFDAKINPDKKAIEFKLTSPQIKIKGDLQQIINEEKTKLQGRADCEYDWSAVSAVARPFLPEGLKLEGDRKDTINFSSEYQTGQTDKLLANLNTEGKLGFAKAGFMGLDFGPAEVDIQVKKGLLEITPFSTTVNNGQFNFAGGADFKQKPTLFKIAKPIHIVKDVQINEETTEKLLMYVNPIFANAVNVSGVADFNCERLAIPLSDTPGNELEVIGTISISQLRLQASDLLGQILTASGASSQGQNITLHPTRFVLQKGFLRYDDMQIDVDDKPINFRGVIGVDDKSLDMTVTLPYSLKSGPSSSRISLPLRGTIDKPEIDLGKLLEGQLKEQLEEQLKEHLEGEVGEKIIEGLEGLFK